MAATGQSFELDAHTFTLGNMFAMQLHRFAADIGRITSAAVKELTIESELKKMAEVWKEQKFDLRKYHKVGGWGWWRWLGCASGSDHCFQDDPARPGCPWPAPAAQ